MRELQPVLTGELFGEVRRELVSLLKGLKHEEWELPTAAPKWNVKDVAWHLVGGDVGNLSRRRDGFSLPGDLSSHEKLVAFINEINAVWVAAGQRVSARTLMDLTEHVGRQADEYFAALQPFATGAAVSWAGDRPMPVWFDVAREYTERWHHQQQIRDATGRPGLYEKRLFEPVLDTFVRALPQTFRDVQAESGSVVELNVTGVLNKTWALVGNDGKWQLFEGGGPRQDAVVTIKAEDGWKIFTRGFRGEEAERRAEMSGDRRLAEKVLEMVSVIA
jgi:uncharacterized protein (TIGR03083 family)